eukprot:3576097-Rhodomonas_salina.5
MFFANHFAGNFWSLPQTHWYSVPFGNFQLPSLPGHTHTLSGTGMFGDLRAQVQVPGWYSVISQSQCSAPAIPPLNAANSAASAHAFTSHQNDQQTNNFNWTEMHLVNNTDTIALDLFGDEECREREKAQDKAAKTRNAEKNAEKKLKKLQSSSSKKCTGGRGGSFSDSDSVSDSNGPTGRGGGGSAAASATSGSINVG